MSGLNQIIVLLSLLVLVECDIIFKNENLTRTKRQNNNGCVLPLKPDFGDWEVINAYKNPGETVPQNTIVKFTCNDGYKLNTPTPFMVCGHQWDLNNIPQCKELCEAFYSTSTTTLTCRDANGIQTDCDKVIDGGTLAYECIPYYEVPHRSPKQLFCFDGKWSSNKPLCEPVCGNTVTSHTVVPAVGGGTSLKKIKYPWITAIYQRDGVNLVNICGGSIIARKLVLTAAHCVANEYGNALAPSDYIIAAAKLFNRYKDPRDVDAEYHDVESILVNTDYKGSGRRYVADVALIITKTLFTLGPLVQPVCLKGVTDITLHAAYDKGEIAGWGVTETNQPSDELRYLEIPYKSQRRCEQELPPDFLEKYKFQDKICAGFFKQNISVCRGDSGSGLAFKNRWDHGRYYIHGIVSLTSFSGEIDKCNLQQNSLYTGVAYYYSWIEKYVARYQVEECQLPPYPTNGRYEVESARNKNPGDSIFSSDWLKVSCNSGYHPFSPRVSCQFANSYTLQCQPDAKCPLPKLPQGATFSCKDTRNVLVDCSKASHGIILQFICPDGYSSNGPRTRLCMNNSWGTPQTLCIPNPIVTTTSTEPATTTSSSTTIETTTATDSDSKGKVMCTYASWAAHNDVSPEDLNPNLCTHIYYAFAGIWEKGDIRVQDDTLDLNMGLYRRVTDLKKKNRNLKVLLSVGGDAASNSSLFSLVAAGGPAKINSFIGSASYFLQTYEFDGLNIDWHYPEVSDKDNYINFLRQIKDAFKKNGWLLSASVRSYPDQTGYDGTKMNEILDWVILKTFDMYGAWNSYTGEHTALYASPKEYEWEKQHLNVDASVQLWLKTGLSKSKMVVSVAFYGRSFQLKSKNEHDIHAPILGYGIKGGNVKYSEICSEYGNWSGVWNDVQKSAYIYKDDQWISYDDRRAMTFKGTYVEDHGFLGVNVWPVDADDVFGKCGHKFELLRHLRGALGYEVNWESKA